MDIPENHYGLHNGSGRRLPRSSKAAFSETPGRHEPWCICTRRSVVRVVNLHNETIRSAVKICENYMFEGIDRLRWLSLCKDLTFWSLYMAGSAPRRSDQQQPSNFGSSERNPLPESRKTLRTLQITVKLQWSCVRLAGVCLCMASLTAALSFSEWLGCNLCVLVMS